MPDQPTLFEPEHVPDPPAVARVDFLTGMLATWNLGDKKPTKHQRAELGEIARRCVADAQFVLTCPKTTP